MATAAVVRAGDSDPERWRHRRLAWLELAILGVAAVITGWLGYRANQPLLRLSAPCRSVVQYEFAGPAQKVGDEPLTVGPPTIDDLVKRCGLPASDVLGDALRASLARDMWFIAAYVSLLWWGCRRLGRIAPRTKASRIGLLSRFGETRVDTTKMGRYVALVASWLVLAAGLLDCVENGFLLATAGRLDRPSGTYATLTAAAATAKFVLVTPGVLLFVLLLGRLARAGMKADPGLRKEHVFLPPSDAGRRWRVPLSAAGEEMSVGLAAGTNEYGICLSGGGIRSATFGLGALQVLDLHPSKWALQEARYLSAVSGGSYIAATYQYLARTRALAPQDLAPSSDRFKPLVGPAGAVEDHLRRHSTHLADGAAEWIMAIGEVLLRALSGLVILLAVVWAVATPLGWFYRSSLLGLRDGKPIPVSGRLLAAPALALLVFLTLRLWFAYKHVAFDNPTGDDRPGIRQALIVAVVGLLSVVVVLPFIAANSELLVNRGAELLGLSDKSPSAPSRDEVLKDLSAVVESASASGAGAATAAKATGTALPALADQVRVSLAASVETAEVAAELARRSAEDLRLELAGEPPPGDLPLRFTSDELAPACTGPSNSLATATGPNKLDWAVLLACRAANASADAASQAAKLAAIVVDSAGADPGVRADVAAAANQSAASAAKASTNIVDLRGTLNTNPTTSRANPPVAWAGLSAIVTALGGLMAKKRLDIGNRPAGPRKTRDFTKKLGFGGRTEVLAGILSAVLLVVAFSDVVVDAWKRGPYGPLDLGYQLGAWKWWAIGCAGLVAVHFTDVNRWSLRDFYHRHLWRPYAVEADGSEADWHGVDTRLSDIGRRPAAFPELLLCAAAQVSGRHWAPPGRRALSFVFNASACGGPEVGYIRTDALEDLLGTSRNRRPITLFGAVATSGAAFGPAMGRESKGGLGAMLAVANARLGAWIPNPHHLIEMVHTEVVEELQLEMIEEVILGVPAEAPPTSIEGGPEDVPNEALVDVVVEVPVNLVLEMPMAVRAGSLRRTPNLAYWFREILGQYALDDRLVLTTDGGHVENLGLVELLRRRCGRILAFDASGAGATPTTLAEALVMAREELDVRVQLYGVDNRPLLDVKRFGADPFHRVAKDDPSLAERLAGVPVIRGRISYPAVHEDGFHIEESSGILVYGSLTMTDTTAWAVLEYGQRNSDFPNDGTDKQWFRENTFSAYQQLGRDVATAMLAVADKLPPVSDLPV